MAKGMMKEMNLYLQKRIKAIVPVLYSCVLLTLWDMLAELNIKISDDDKQIFLENLVNRSQDKWKVIDGYEEMFKECEEVTGFDVRGM